MSKQTQIIPDRIPEGREDRDTERMLLAVAFEYPEKWTTLCTAAKPEDFTDSRLREVFTHALTIWREGETPTIEAVKGRIPESELPDYGATLGKLVGECDLPSQFQDGLKRLLELSRNRQFDAPIHAAYQSIMKPDPDRAMLWAILKRAGETYEEGLAELGLEAVDLPQGPGLLHKALQTMHEAGLAGEDTAAGLLYLAITSRVLDRPVNVFVVGQSSGGKSEVVRRVAAMFHKGCVHNFTTLSPKSLYYTDRDFRHRVLWISEPEGIGDDPVLCTTLRGLAWEGKIRISSVDTSSGKPESLERELPGPTGLILTGTRDAEGQLSTRMLTVEITDSAVQTRAVMRAIAAGEKNEPKEQDLKPWHALSFSCQREALSVVVPFADWLSDNLPAKAMRSRRDFSQLLTVIKAHARLESGNRKRDAHGRVVAEIGDYAVVRELLPEVLVSTAKDGLTSSQREAVAVVGDLATDKAEGVTYQEVADVLKVGDASTALRRLQRPMKLGYVVNQTERKGHPARLKLGNALPGGQSSLPEAEVMAEALGLTGEWVDALTGEHRSIGSVGVDGPDAIATDHATVDANTEGMETEGFPVGLAGLQPITGGTATAMDVRHGN